MPNLKRLFRRKYKYTLTSNHYFYNINLKGVYFTSKYFDCLDGHCTIYKGYSWNGCSFVKDFAETYIASAEHDCLYQFGYLLGLKRKYADIQFYNTMVDYHFKYSKLYYNGVRTFGFMFYYF